MLHFRRYFLIFVLLVSFSVKANEDMPAVGGTDTFKEQIEFSGQQDEAWMKLQTDLGSLKTKLDTEQAIVNELLMNKKESNGRFTKGQIEQLTLHHKKLQEQAKEYDQKLNEFEMKYPEKGQALGRQYNRKKTQTLDEMENSLTLEGRIKKINKKIKTQYKAVIGSETKPQKTPQPQIEKKSELHKPIPKDDVTNKIILVK